MEIAINLGINLTLCFVGLLAYGLWSTRNHMHDFDWGIFWGHNRIFWVWSGIAQLLYASLMAFYPILEEWIAKKMIAILEAATVPDLGVPESLVQTVVYLTLAWQLSRFTNVSVKKQNKIGHKKLG